MNPYKVIKNEIEYTNEIKNDLINIKQNEIDPPAKENILEYKINLDNMNKSNIENKFINNFQSIPCSEKFNNIIKGNNPIYIDKY